jgi:diaminohydroxyphosphoribosylaminopyrimidine deaminase/5-amino-6-(5-phosphoribosylamino)uracil reductase
MAAALALSRRVGGRTGSNPNVGCLIIRDGRVAGRGWTADGGRPHAEAMALVEAGDRARGATAYVTLEPCVHESTRGPACADLLVEAGLARVVVALTDPDPRTAGLGLARLRAGGVAVTAGVLEEAAADELAGFAARVHGGRAELVLMLALSLDGRAADAALGPVARAWAGRCLARADLILDDRADLPPAGTDGPGAIRAVVGKAAAPAGALSFPTMVALEWFAKERGLNRLLCAGGAGLAGALLAEGRVDRLVLLRAPLWLGAGAGFPGAGAGRWQLHERRPLGPDLLEIFRPHPTA